MAILGTATVDELSILSVDVDPSISGVIAPLGSLALLDNNTNAKIWIKTSAATTGWSVIPISALSTTYPVGAVIFADASGNPTGITTKMFWDNTNNRLAIGANAPAAPQSTIHIDRGTGVGGHIRFTSGTTTGQAAGDGFELGIDNAGNAEFNQFENSPMNWLINGTRRLQLNPAGQFVVGANATAADITGAAIFPTFQIIGTSETTNQMATITYSNDTIPSVVNLLKSRGALGAQGLVQSGDELGRVQFRGSDGANFQAGASVRAAVDGVASAGSMPGRLLLQTTPTGATIPVTALTIDSTQMAIFANAIRIGTTANAVGGNIRYVSDSNIQGYIGGQWRSFVNIPVTAVTSVATSTTTSATDVLLDNMTLAPGAGTYNISFDTTLQSSSAGAVIFVSVYANNVQVASSQRQVIARVDASGGFGGSNSVPFDCNIHVQAIVTVADAQTIEIRWRRSAGTATSLQRSMIVTKVNI